MAHLQEAGEGRVHFVPAHPGERNDVTPGHVQIGGHCELVMGKIEIPASQISQGRGENSDSLQSAEQDAAIGVGFRLQFN